MFSLKQPLLTSYRLLDMSNTSTFMADKKDVIARFIHVSRALMEVYELPPTSVHLYVDAEGGIIAFNRNASLFLNIRYFEQWRKFLTSTMHGMSN